jgi:hypothetical protein
VERASTLADPTPEQPGRIGLQFDLGGLAVILGGLLVPVRRFFPK